MEVLVVSLSTPVEFLGETPGVWPDEFVGGGSREDLAVEVDPQWSVISEVVDEGE